MRLTRLTSNSIRILIHCANAGETFSKAPDIARMNDISEPNVFKTMPILVQAEFLESVRGPKGGVRLAQEPSEIKLGDIIRATEETHIEANCFGGATDCPIRPVSPINRIFENAWLAFLDVLDQHTLQDILDARPTFPIPGMLAEDEEEEQQKAS